MELNLTQNKFCVNSCLYKTTQEIGITADINLPDYCTDVAKILKTTLTPEITSKNLGEKRISVEGIARITMIYCDTEGKVRSYTVTEPYSKNFESEEDLSNGKLFISMSNCKITARSLSPRKTECKASFDLSVEVRAKKDISLISEVTGGGAESECGEIEAENYIAMENKLIVLDELLDIGQGNPPVSEIVRYDISPKIHEVKQIANKIILKGEAGIKILYTADDEDGTLQEFETSSLISQIIDIEGADEDSLCSADIKLLSATLKGKSDSVGEVRSISTEIILEVSVECKKKMKLPIILDAYSTECEMKIEREMQTFTNLADTFSESEIYKKNLELPTGDISEINSVWCYATINGTSCTDNKLTIRGAINISILGLDDGNTPFCTERTVDFEYNEESEKINSDSTAEVDVSVKNCGYILKGGNCMELRVEVDIEGKIYQNCQKSIITGLSLEEENKLDKSSLAALTVYFAVEGESVWDIAKKYATAKKKIMEDNNLDSDILKTSGMLLISSK